MQDWEKQFDVEFPIGVCNQGQYGFNSQIKLFIEKLLKQIYTKQIDSIKNIEIPAYINYGSEEIQEEVRSIILDKIYEIWK